MKRNFIITACCVLFFSIFMLFSVNNGNAEKPNLSVKIPPPIEGIILKEDRKSQFLSKESISILGANGVKHNYLVEIARTADQQRIGMMFREHISENTGMLFLFPEEEKRSFWMKNTLIPLDIIFIRKDGIIHHIHPMAEVESLKPISSNGEVLAVLEIAGGEVEILKINVGDRILHDVFLPKK